MLDMDPFHLLTFLACFTIFFTSIMLHIADEKEDERS